MRTLYAQPAYPSLMGTTSMKAYGYGVSKLGDQDGIDVAEDDDGFLPREEEIELFCPSPAEDEAEKQVEIDCGDEAPEPSYIQLLEDNTEAAVCETDLEVRALGDPGSGDDPPRPSDDGDDVVDPPSLAVEEPPPPPWAGFGAPSAAGYVYAGGRSVMRIQRRDDEGRCWVNCCGRHGECRLNIPLPSAPDDVTLFRWYFEGEQAVPGTAPDRRKALAKQHMELGRERWGFKKNPRK